MRLLFTNLLATTLLLMGASAASAVSFDLTSNYNGTDVLAPSDTVTVQIFLNTEGQLDLALIDVGLQFDPAILQYQDTPNSMTSYILYAPGSGSGKTAVPANWLIPLPQYINGGTVDFYGGLDASSTLFAVAPFNQVNTGYQEPAFNGSRITGDGILLSTIVFHVIAVGDGLADVTLVMNSQNRVQTANPIIVLDSQVGLTGAFAVITPEPGTALMVGLGLAGLAIAGRRTRA